MNIKLMYFVSIVVYALSVMTGLCEPILMIVLIAAVILYFFASLTFPEYDEEQRIGKVPALHSHPFVLSAFVSLAFASVAVMFSVQAGCVLGGGTLMVMFAGAVLDEILLSGKLPMVAKLFSASSLAPAPMKKISRIR